VERRNSVYVLAACNVCYVPRGLRGANIGGEQRRLKFIKKKGVETKKKRGAADRNAGEMVMKGDDLINCQKALSVDK